MKDFLRQNGQVPQGVQVPQEGQFPLVEKEDEVLVVPRT